MSSSQRARAKQRLLSSGCSGSPKAELQRESKALRPGQQWQGRRRAALLVRHAAPQAQRSARHRRWGCQLAAQRQRAPPAQRAGRPLHGRLLRPARRPQRPRRAPQRAQQRQRGAQSCACCGWRACCGRRMQHTPRPQRGGGTLRRPPQHAQHAQRTPLGAAHSRLHRSRLQLRPGAGHSRRRLLRRGGRSAAIKEGRGRWNAVRDRCGVGWGCKGFAARAT